MNNYEKIKNMSIEEMSIFLKNFDCINCDYTFDMENYRCTECVEQTQNYLQQEAEQRSIKQ